MKTPSDIAGAIEIVEAMQSDNNLLKVIIGLEAVAYSYEKLRKQSDSQAHPCFVPWEVPG